MHLITVQRPKVNTKNQQQKRSIERKQKPYLDHLFVNAKVSVGVEIGDIEVRTRTRRPLRIVVLLQLGNPRVGSGAALVMLPAAGAPARASSSQLSAVSVEEAIVECGIAA